MSDVVKSGAFADNGLPIATFGWIADQGACGHYRITQPLKTLARKHDAQVEIGAGSRLPYTILVAQRTHGVEQTKFLAHIRQNRQAINGMPVPKIVYELDDDLWEIEPTNAGYKYYTTPGVFERAAQCIAMSDAVTVSTEPLAERIRKANPNVFVVPNSIPKKYLHEGRYPYQLGSLDKPFVIGWSGSATHVDDFKQCAGGLSTFLKFNPNSRMCFFGTDYRHLLDPAVHDQCRNAPWTSTVGEYMNLLSAAQIDVMLAPLAPSVFNESKSNLRLIEANALGIPVIATNWGPYSADLTPGGIYVDVDQSWVSAIADMQALKMKRLEMSRLGREWVEANYLQENTIDLWLEAYSNVLSQ